MTAGTCAIARFVAFSNERGACKCNLTILTISYLTQVLLIFEGTQKRSPAYLDFSLLRKKAAVEKAFHHYFIFWNKYESGKRQFSKYLKAHWLLSRDKLNSCWSCISNLKRRVENCTRYRQLRE